MTTPSHIVVVQFENQDFNAVIGNPAAPFLNKRVGGHAFHQL